MIKSLKKIFILVLFLGIFLTNIPTTKAAIVLLPNQNQAPKMITMSLYGDSSTMAFNYNTAWETDTILQVVKQGQDFTDDNITEFVGSTTKSQVLNDGFIHKVVATGLAEDTAYNYRLGDKELDNWSDVGTFTTRDNSNSLRFIHISDPQGYEEIHYDNYNELLTRAVSNSNPNFIALTGDVVNASYVDAVPNLEQWHWALTDQKEILQNIPVMATSGNHDAAHNDFNSRFNFNAAENSETLTGVYYSFDYNNTHFVVLNTNDSNSENGQLRGLSDAQINWLINDLSTNDSNFTIVMMHKGIYDSGGHCSNMEGADGDIALIRKQLTPIFTQYKVDLVLQGHDHLYSRSYPIISTDAAEFSVTADKENQKVPTVYNNLDFNMYQNPIGAIYLNSGTASGSKYYAPVAYDENLIPIEVTDGSSDRMYTEIVIEGDNLYATVYKLNNKKLTVFDTFGISKTSNANIPNNPDNPNNPSVDNNSPAETQDYTLLIVLSIVLVVAILTVVILVVLKKKRGGNNEKYSFKERE